MSASPVTGHNHAKSSGVAPEPRVLEARTTKHADEHDEREHDHSVEWTELVRIGFVALAALAVWFRIWEPFPHVSIVGIAATLIGGYPIFKEAFENIVERKMTMELSMTIALLAALAIGEFFTALVIAGFVLVAEVLEGLTVGRGRSAIRRLVGLLPKSATVRRNGIVAGSRYRGDRTWGYGPCETRSTNSGGRHGHGRPFLCRPSNDHGRINAG